jgi:tetratricopeptide (TPR) repeat protein
VKSVLETFPGTRWPELEAAEELWTKSGVDEFGPLLEESVLAGKSPDQMYALAGELLEIPARLGDAQRIIEESLEIDPGSFRLHFLASALGFMQVMKAQESKPEPDRALTAKLLHHMQVAVALRPRSGFVRAMQANALAVNGSVEEAIHCMDVATELEPKNALVWLFRARFYGYTPWPERGVEACKKALELDPGIGGARKLMDELEAKTKKG